MTVSGPRERRRGARRDRERSAHRRERRAGPARRALKLLGGVVLAGLVFLAGISLGRALEQTPEPGGTQTLVRTLEPETLPPVTRTITVTTGAE